MKLHFEGSITDSFSGMYPNKLLQDLLVGCFGLLLWLVLDASSLSQDVKLHSSVLKTAFGFSFYPLPWKSKTLGWFRDDSSCIVSLWILLRESSTFIWSVGEDAVCASAVPRVCLRSRSLAHLDTAPFPIFLKWEAWESPKSLDPALEDLLFEEGEIFWNSGSGSVLRA